MHEERRSFNFFHKSIVLETNEMEVEPVNPIKR